MNIEILHELFLDGVHLVRALEVVLEQLLDSLVEQLLNIHKAEESCDLSILVLSLEQGVFDDLVNLWEN